MLSRRAPAEQVSILPPRGGFAQWQGLAFFSINRPQLSQKVRLSHAVEPKYSARPPRFRNRFYTRRGLSSSRARTCAALRAGPAAPPGCDDEEPHRAGFGEIRPPLGGSVRLSQAVSQAKHSVCTDGAGPTPDSRRDHCSFLAVAEQLGIWIFRFQNTILGLAEPTFRRRGHRFPRVQSGRASRRSAFPMRSAVWRVRLAVPFQSWKLDRVDPLWQALHASLAVSKRTDL